MSEEIFPYDQWVNEALLKVLARALKQLSEKGPSDSHHFFIDIQTGYQGVKIPNFLRTQYPDEITIVLQHQFEQLVVNEDSFEVSLSFGGKKSRLKIPFGAVTSFADPSVNFGLQIGIQATSDEVIHLRSKTELNKLSSTDDQETRKRIEPLPRPLKKSAVREIDNTLDNKTSIEERSDNTDPDREAQTAKVIALDTFRKK